MAEMYYRKQWVEAFQFWPQNTVGGDGRPLLHVEGLHSYFIKTAAGELEIVPGDWIVRETDGAIHIVSPDEFAGNYERPAEPARKKKDG